MYEKGLTVKRQQLTLTLAAMLALAIIAPNVASGHFTRSFLRRITETTPGTQLSPSGVAVDSGNSVWVSQPGGLGPFALNDFASSELGNTFVKTLEIEGLDPPEVEPSPGYRISFGLTPPRSIAIDESTGTFYTTGRPTTKGDSESSVEVFDKTGAYLKRFAIGSRADFVAFDNSTDPSDHSTGSVYTAVEGEGGGIYKFNASGEKVNFSGSASYIAGNEIVSTPNGERFSYGGPAAITTDAAGDIYFIDMDRGNYVVDELAPSGQFIRTIRGTETPGLGGHDYEGGFGGRVAGVAIDPTSGHLLISVTESNYIEATNTFTHEGAIDEFDTSTGRFVSQILGTSEERLLQQPSGSTVDSHGNLYVVDAAADVVDVYGPGRFLPSFKSAVVTEAGSTSLALNGFVDPEGFSLSDCHFEYVTEAAFESTGFSDLSSGGDTPCVPSAASIPVDSTFHSVQAKVKEHLVSGTTYRYRLLATTSGSLGGTSTTDTLAFTVPAAPRVDSTTEGNLSSSFADLHALINPLGADTSYRFQYVDQAHYNPEAEDPYAAGETAPVMPFDIGSGGPTGSSDATVVQHVGGLAAGVTYHFRVVATNVVGTTFSPDRTFTTLPQVTTGLPDNRAYELVTPPNKGDAEDMFAPSEEEHDHFAETEYGSPSEAGNGFLFKTYASFGESPASGENGYVFSRGARGWSYIPLAVPSLGVQSVSPDVFDPADMSKVGVEDEVGSVASPAGAQLTSIIGPVGGPYTTLHVDPPAGHNEFEADNTHIVGASRDLSHVVLESLDHTLAPGAEGGSGDVLYEYSGGPLKLVNVDSGGAPVSPCGAILGQSKIPGTSHGAVSADGSKVFFTAPDPYARNAEGSGGCWNGHGINAPQLYMRTGKTTSELSAPEEAAPDTTANHPAVYVGASEDGSRVFFVSEGELTTNSSGAHDRELYEYDTKSRKLTRVSGGESGSAADVLTVPAISADGSTVYFTATGRLTGSAPASIGEGEADLYRYETTSRTTVYVATVGQNDYPRDTLSGWAPMPWVGLLSSANWYTTPDGRYLVFATKRALTGYSTVEASPGDCPEGNGISPNGHCQEIYRYDAVSAALECLSCDPTGAAPTSNASFADSAMNSIQWGAGPVRAMSNDGAYVFFNTGDALVPRDGNGKLDVYEWHEGRISLISSGNDLSPSFFLGASASGHDVFFGTHARLASADADSAGDLYDARICTASDPCIEAAAGETAQCEGDTCQNPPPPPIEATPGSLTFSGAGNFVTPTAAGKSVKPLTRTQLLAKAMKVCRHKPKRQRAGCERRARKRYSSRASKRKGTK
jgi:hypothetical protein